MAVIVVVDGGFVELFLGAVVFLNGTLNLWSFIAGRCI